MTLSKPTVGATGWNSQVDALFDRVNELDGVLDAADLAAHTADTTNVHGITDTSVLETTTGSAAKVATHAAAADPHGDRAFTTSAVATHAAATDPHGDRGYTDTVAATKQPLDADLTTIAALDSTTAGALATDGSGWIRKTYAQLKTALSLVKADVGLGNVDNTADTAKPISTATQTALDAKQPLDSDLTTIAGLTATTDSILQSKSSAWTTRTPAQLKTDLVLVKADVGLGSVDNTADTAKPVSTLQRAAVVSGLYGNSLWAAGGCEPHNRHDSTAQMPSDIAIFSYVTAPAASVITKLGMAISGTAAAGVTLARLGVYTVDGSSNLTLVARTAASTTFGNTVSTAPTMALSTVGGFPASYTFIPGQRYALASLYVATTVPGIYGIFCVSHADLTPRLASRAYSQTDLATSYTAASVADPHWFVPYVFGQA